MKGIHFKQTDKSDLHLSEQAESQLQMRDNPEEIAIQMERLLHSLRNYKCSSDVVDLAGLRNSAKAELKRYKESAYWGETHQGKRHGQGVMLYANGRIYEGFWTENCRNGKGFQRFSNGSTYKGTYVCGKPQGCGRYQWQNGEVYEGQWKNGVKHGSGIWRGSKGDSYIGEWQQGKAEGYGVHTWTNGDRYEGQFRNCLKHGQGVQRFANGDTYKGMYESGKPSGYGQYYWSSGSFFKGNFEDGLRSGQGVWKKGPGRSDKYEGEWLNDKKQGYGVFTWADGNIYKGHYVNDLRQGFGEMLYIDGSVYRGNWKADQQMDVCQESEEIQHDHDCELFAPSRMLADGGFQEGCNQKDHQYFLENQLMPQPMPMYREPQRPAILKSASRNFRPRNLTKTSSRSQKSRVQSQGKIRGMTKKLSVGTVANKPNPYKQDMSASFYLYKIHGQDSQKSRENINRRQVRTSGGTRGRVANVDEQLKYFARSKISSYSQLQ